jgi:aminoglycoside/choline kinase family phosphotransferase
VDALQRLFEARFGRRAAFVAPLAADGSRRRMVRLTLDGSASAIGVLGPEPEENRAFLSFSRTFRGLGLPVPEVLGEDLAEGVYLVEDLGDTTLFQALTQARKAEPGAFPQALVPVYRRVLGALPRFQVEGGRAIDFGLAYPHAAFDRRSMAWDLNYFKYNFLKFAEIPFHEGRLEEDFERLTGFLLEADARFFLYRDFQSRNVMLRDAPPREGMVRGAGLEDATPWFIDYQGGRRGALAYDVASLLYDAKAELTPAVRQELLDHYLDVLGAHLAVDRERFLFEFRGFTLIRILQALGAYGYRGFYERKPHFLASVPPALENIEHLLRSGPLPVPLPELRAVFERMLASERLRITPAPASGGLTVYLGSFSYKRGMPVDPGGNGGGFVFDCRALHNPGKDAVQSALCGRDRPVIRALEARPEVHAFLAHAQALVESQVASYHARGWSALSVQFGCTGGQHRSVYMAERLAAFLRARFPDVRIDLQHAERGRWPATADCDPLPLPAPLPHGATDAARG